METEIKDETTMITKSSIETTESEKLVKESTLFNLSVRAIIALLVIITICIMSIDSIKIEEPLYTMSTMIVAFFYGQNTTKTSKTTQ